MSARMDARPEAEVRLKRPPGFYASDNELVDDLAAEIGIYAFGVYHLLLRKAAQYAGVKMSQREIAGTLAISTDSARNAIATLKNAGLIEERPSEDANDPPLYLIVFAKDVIAARKVGDGRPEFRTRVRTKRVRKSGQVEGENQDGNVLNFVQTRPEFRTPNIEVNENQTSVPNNTPPAPKGGEACSLQSDQKSACKREQFDRDGESQVADVAMREKSGASEAEWTSSKRAAEALMASTAVLMACGVSGDARLQAVIEDALAAHCRRDQCTMKLAKMLAIENVKAYVQDAPLLRFTWGWKKFFRDGYWRESRLWPYDKEKSAQMRRRL